MEELRAGTENRPLTPSVLESRTQIWAEVVEIALQYGARVATIIDKLIGVEVPIRMTLADQNGEAIDFASHLDLIGRNKAGQLVVWDWKWRDEDPSYDYLVRNLQLGLYWLAVRRGEILIDGEWVAMDEAPEVSWVHLPNLKVYSRKTKRRGPDGEDIEFAAGDLRPMETIVKHAPFRSESAIRDEVALRVSMMRAGLYPTNPQPDGCRFCESRQFCTRFSEENT